MLFTVKPPKRRRRRSRQRTEKLAKLIAMFLLIQAETNYLDKNLTKVVVVLTKMKFFQELPTVVKSHQHKTNSHNKVMVLHNKAMVLLHQTWAMVLLHQTWDTVLL